MKSFLLFTFFSIFISDAFSQNQNENLINIDPDKEAGSSLNNFSAENLLVVGCDIMGNEIYSKVEVSEKNGFLLSSSSNGHHLPSGIYLITASANDVIFRQKLIVK